MPQIWNPFSRDHGELTACAQALLRGAALYRDCWENKGPLTYPFFMLPVAIWPTMLSVRLFDVLWQLLTVLVLWWVIARMCASTYIGALAAAVYWALYMGSGFWNTMQSETFAALFIALCGYGLWRGTPRGLFAAGVCAGVFVWIKYPNVLIALGMGCVMLWQNRRAPVATRLTCAARYALGALAVSALVMAYLTFSGAFPAFLRHLYFLQGPFAVRHDLVTTIDLAWLALRNLMNDASHIGPVAKPTVPIWNIAGFGFPILWVLALYALWRYRRNPAIGYWAMTWLGGFIGIVWQARYSPYHNMLLLMPLVAAASLALAPKPKTSAVSSVPAEVSPNDTLPQFALHFVLVAALIGGVPGIRDWYSNVIVQGKTARQVYDDTSMHDELVLSDWLQAHSTPQDRIAIWGIAANVYFVSQRQNATSFNFIIPFEYDSLYRDDWVNQYVSEMAARQPKFVVVSKDDYPTPGVSAQRVLQNIAPINDYLETHYQYIGESTVFLLYERK